MAARAAVATTSTEYLFIGVGNLTTKGAYVQSRLEMELCPGSFCVSVSRWLSVIAVENICKENYAMT